MAKRIKKRKKKTRKVVNTIHDVLSIAWEADVPCPPKETEKLTTDEVSHRFPQLFALFLLHKGQVKSTKLIAHNAKLIASFKLADFLKMSQQDLVDAGVKINANLVRVMSEDFDEEAALAEFMGDDAEDEDADADGADDSCEADANDTDDSCEADAA